jgi:hypothetical protein
MKGVILHFISRKGHENLIQKKHYNLELGDDGSRRKLTAYILKETIIDRQEVNYMLNVMHNKRSNMKSAKKCVL